MNLTIISIGNKLSPWELEGIKYYTKQLKNKIDINFINIKGQQHPKRSIEEVLKLESEYILKKIPDNSFLISWDSSGDMVDSKEFSKIFENSMINNLKLCFVIGGSFGLDKNILNNSHPVIITLARLELRKGHKLVLNALSRLIEKYPNLLYIIAGDGPSKKVIEEYARTLGISNNICFLGWITEPEKSVLLKSTNLFVMTPQLDNQSVEGFGMSFIDAAFHGLATVGTDSGGIPDAIIDGKTGLIAKTSDVSDITAKIDELLSDPKKRLMLGKAGQKNALEKFQWKNKVKEYLDLIKIN